MREVNSKLVRMSLFKNIMNVVSQNLAFYLLQFGNIQLFEMIAQWWFTGCECETVTDGVDRLVAHNHPDKWLEYHLLSELSLNGNRYEPIKITYTKIATFFLVQHHGKTRNQIRNQNAGESCHKIHRITLNVSVSVWSAEAIENGQMLQNTGWDGRLREYFLPWNEYSVNRLPPLRVKEWCMRWWWSSIATTCWSRWLYRG